MKKIGLALGGGGAKGFAHIPILEVFDELGIKPACLHAQSRSTGTGWKPILCLSLRHQAIGLAASSWNSSTLKTASYRSFVNAPILSIEI